jgi:hypothetical protein
MAGQQSAADHLAFFEYPDIGLNGLPQMWNKQEVD